MIFEMMTCIPSVSIIPSLNYYCIKDGYSEIDLGYKKYEDGKIKTDMWKIKRLALTNHSCQGRMPSKAMTDVRSFNTSMLSNY